MKNYLNRPIMWKTEYTDGTIARDLFIGVRAVGDLLYDAEDDRWVDLQYAKENCLDDLYHFTDEQIDKIQFDEHGRPYIQDNGRMMLSRKTMYNYSIKN